MAAESYEWQGVTSGTMDNGGVGGDGATLGSNPAADLQDAVNAGSVPTLDEGRIEFDPNDSRTVEDVAQELAVEMNAEARAKRDARIAADVRYAETTEQNNLSIITTRPEPPTEDELWEGGPDPDNWKSADELLEEYRDKVTDWAQKHILAERLAKIERDA